MSSRYILLPEGGIRGNNEQRDWLLKTLDLDRANAPLRLPEGPAERIAILDTINENGAKLTVMSDSMAEAINRSRVPLRARREVILRHPKIYPHRPATLVQTPAAIGASLQVRCIDAVSNAPLAGQEVVVFDDFERKSGDRGITDAHGRVNLVLNQPHIDRLFVLSNDHYWGSFRSDLPIAGLMTLAIQPLRPDYRDSIRQTYAQRQFVPGTGVRIGIVDTGVGPHRDLRIEGGACTVTGANPGMFADVDIHGTHVAGLVAGDGGTGAATFGLAPGAKLQAYRVFEYSNGDLLATNYAVLKAMILAAQNQCDIVNLSLGGGPSDEIVEECIRDAREQGMLVTIAAGNDHRGAVGFPAAYPGATAVSAMGRSDGYPADCYFLGDVEFPPKGNDPLEYIAAFSNIGPQISCTGLGSGVLSTLPNDRFGPLSGTSMAAPMLAGAAASLLSQNPAIYNMPRNRARSDAIEGLLFSQCIRHFGDPKWEGFGLPDPRKI